MTHTKHAQPVHHKLPINSEPKKHGAGEANWGSLEDEIRQGLEEARSPDYVGPHDPQNDGSLHKINVSSGARKDKDAPAPSA
ncbi:hypothetical protein JCM8097_000861 [Rhodosporidiobolus ruineniae]